LDHVSSPDEVFSFTRLRSAALSCLKETRPAVKCSSVRALRAAWQAGQLSLETEDLAATESGAGIPAGRRGPSWSRRCR
jgi:hypothetical protein